VAISFAAGLTYSAAKDVYRGIYAMYPYPGGYNWLLGPLRLRFNFR